MVCVKKKRNTDTDAVHKWASIRAGLPARGREGTQWLIEGPDQKFPGSVAPETRIANAT
jgi:hypothetical protein